MYLTLDERFGVTSFDPSNGFPILSTVSTLVADDIVAAIEAIAVAQVPQVQILVSTTPITDPLDGIPAGQYVTEAEFASALASALATTVQVVPQSFDSGAEAQARENIGAISSADTTTLFKWQGVFDASGGAYPTTDGSGGSIKQLDIWTISVEGVLPGPAHVVPGDILIAKTDTPGSSAANWEVIATGSGLRLFITPDDHGAKGNGVTDDTAALQAAIDETFALGGGVVYLTPGRFYGWKGVLTVKTAVTLVGQVIRQNTPLAAAANVPGLVALDGTAQLKIGDWSNANALAPGGVRSLYVDGNNVGASSTAKKGLVRIAGGNTAIEDLYTVRSAGDGTVYDGTQNSRVTGGLSVGNVGVALVLDNGPGALTFHGGYYGTSEGGNLEFRDTAGETSIYPFGPTQCAFYGTIFEDDNAMTTPHAHNVHLKCGFNVSFYTCNFSGNIVNSAGCSLLIDNTEQGLGLPVFITLDNCLYNTANGQDAVRVVAGEWVFFSGIQSVGDDNVHHAPSFVCLDSGFPKISIEGEVLCNAATPIFRTINGGAVAGAFNNKDTGTNWRLRALQLLTVQEESDTGHRLSIDRDGAFRWFNNSTTVIDGSLSNDPTAGNGMITGGIWQIGNGLKIRSDAALVTTVGATVTFDSGKAGAACHTIGFQSTGNSITTLNLTGGVEGLEMKIELLGTGVNAITWPANVIFSGATPQPLDSEYAFICFRYSGTHWYETTRSVNLGTVGKIVTKTANYTANYGDVVLADTTGGTFTVTVPPASGGKSHVSVKWSAGTVAPTIAASGSDHFNLSSGSTSFAPKMLNQGYRLESDAVSVWVITADDLPLSGLDSRYLTTSAPAYAALTAYTAGQLVTLADGGLAYRTAAGISRATYDATERALWTYVPGGHLEILTPGSGNWVCPAGITTAQAKLFASGGSGAGAGSPTAAQLQTGGGGGGAGDINNFELTGLVAATSYAYTVGAVVTGGGGGAAGGHTGTGGTVGNDTTFTGPGGTVYTSKGGGPGTASGTSTTTTVGGGLYGFNGSAGNGVLWYPGCGNASSAGCIANGDVIGGGGGGTATATLGGVAGNARTTPGGGVGNTAGNAGTAAGANGTTATQPGCGGGGGGAGAAGTGAGGTGGSGGPGQIEMRF